MPTALPGSVTSGLRDIVSCVGASAAGRMLAWPVRKSRIFGPRGVEEDVRRFDVAMHDARAVRGVRASATANAMSIESRDLDQAAPQPLLERLAFEQLHRDERRDIAPGADVVDGADVEDG